MTVKMVEEEVNLILPEDLEGFEIEGINKNKLEGGYAVIIKEPLYMGEGKNRVLVGYAHLTCPCCEIDDKAILRAITNISSKGCSMWYDEFDEEGVLRPWQPKEGELK